MFIVKIVSQSLLVAITENHILLFLSHSSGEGEVQD